MHLLRLWWRQFPQTPQGSLPQKEQSVILQTRPDCGCFVGSVYGSGIDGWEEACICCSIFSIWDTMKGCCCCGCWLEWAFCCPTTFSANRAAEVRKGVGCPTEGSSWLAEVTVDGCCCKLDGGGLDGCCLDHVRSTVCFEERPPCCCWISVNMDSIPSWSWLVDPVCGGSDLFVEPSGRPLFFFTRSPVSSEKAMYSSNKNYF
jgi:hypothetical protein